MPKIKAIIFDLDGTIIDSIDYHHQAYLKALKNTGIKLSKKELTKLLGIPAKELLLRILSKHHREKLLWEIYKRKYKIADSRPELIQLTKHTKQILSWLKKNHIKMALATSSAKTFTLKVLKINKIKNYFEAILSWEDVKKPKPSPDIFLKAAKKLKAKKSECLIIEDAEIGIQAGKRSGIKTIALAGTSPTSDLKKFKPDYIIKDLLEIKKFFN